MERRSFGDSELTVSAVALGCWIFGLDWWGHYTEDAAVDLCRFSYDQGVTFFDNGDAYGNGRAETLFGQFLKTRPRPPRPGRDRVQVRLRLLHRPR